MSLKLETKMRDEMVQAIQMQLVPVPAGSVLMQVAQILASLKEEAPEPLTDNTIGVPKKDA